MTAAAKRTGKPALARPVALLSAALIAAAGCAPKLSPEGEAVQVAALVDTVKCRHLGVAEVSAGRRFLPGGTDDGVKDELLIKARTLAAEIGADTVVASDDVADDAQNFRLYICKVQP